MYNPPPNPPSANREEHAARSKACIESVNIKDGEQAMFVLPAFDFRNTNDAQFGQHTSELVFVKRKGDKAVTVAFYTGWTVEEALDHNNNNYHPRLWCPGIYTHYTKRKDADDPETAYKNTDCPYVDDVCYGELGSSLYGETVAQRLVLEGSAAVWEEIDKALA
jgi:hypothetical protein